MQRWQGGGSGWADGGARADTSARGGRLGRASPINLPRGGGMQDTEGGPKTLPDYSTEHSPCSTESILRPVRDVGPTPLCLVKAGAEVRSEARVVTAARGTRLTAPVPI